MAEKIPEEKLVQLEKETPSLVEVKEETPALSEVKPLPEEKIESTLSEI